MRRGFKSYANLLSRQMRQELKLAASAPLCPWQLAVHLAIPIIPLSFVVQYEPESVKFLLSKGSKHFSAVTIFGGNHSRSRLIFHNDNHAPSRQAANISHELAHAILCHAPTPPFSPDSDAEEEASWMGPALLISNEAALHIVETKMPSELAQASYNVSQSLLRMRLNVSGAEIRASRRK